MCQWEYRHLSELEQKDICSWKYEGEYHIYDLPDYQTMRSRQMGFTNPAAAKQYWGFHLHGQLLGFVNIKEEAEAVFIGIGVRPDACNRHYGRHILEITSEIAKQAYPTKPLYLEVRSWNQRAIRCYENAGFKIVGAPFKRVTDIGEGSFYRMVQFND